MKMYKYLTFIFAVCLYAPFCSAEEHSIEDKVKASMRLWEYERGEYLSMLSLQESEINTLNAEEYKSNDGAQLLLALNCIEPNVYNRFHSLYLYRCDDKPLFYISSSALEDPYILAFIKETDRKRALYYIEQYHKFLSSMNASDKGIPIGASDSEYVLEIQLFLESGGIGSNK